jgi:uncharacterized membrane protein YagU involved in acid resistance
MPDPLGSRQETGARRPRPLKTILAGGLVAGVIDLTYAILVYSPRAPIRIPQSVAAGVLGRATSFASGWRSAVLGVVLHFTIATIWATIYFVASRRLPILIRRAVPCGLAYGAFVFLCMRLVVLPLSAIGPTHMRPVPMIAEFVEHWFGVGLPIALSVRRFSA